MLYFVLLFSFVVRKGSAFSHSRAAEPQPVAQTEPAIADQIQASIESGQLEQAAEQARAGLKLYPASAELYQLLGVALFKKQDNQEARRAFKRATELAPGVPENYYDLALLELSENKYRDAVSPLENCLRLQSRNAQAHLLLGRALHNLNETGPAIAHFRKALTIEPRLPLAHYHLGYAYQSQGNLSGALDEFRKEIEINASFYDTYWLAGNIELERGQIDSAERLFRSGVDLNPRRFQACYGLARTLMARKDLPAAEAQLKQALVISPENVEAHYALARVYQQMGNREDADREFGICSRLNAQGQRRSGIAGHEH